MFRVAAVLSTLLIPAAGDTDWWHTNGGHVVGHRDQAGLTCTLTLENDQGRIAFAWTDGLPLRAMVERDDWHLQADDISHVAMRIGDTWLADGDGKPNITALTGRSALMFVVNEPIDDRLLAAREIAVVTPREQFSMGLLPSKVKDLVKALRRCRALIRH
jgi:hypothetical protein